MRKSRIVKTENCLNCGENQGDSNFCPNCGQINNSRKPNLIELFRDALENLFAFDSRFYNTLAPLLFRPGRLTKNFTSGKRAQYVLPIRLFILVTFFLVGVVSCSNRIEKEHWYEVDRPEAEETNPSLLPSYFDIYLDTADVPQATLDSLINNQWVKYDSTKSKFMVNRESSLDDSLGVSFGDNSLTDFVHYAENHPYESVDSALVHLNHEATFWNHLVYSMALKISLMSGDEFINYLGRNILIILLLFIPVMALSMKVLYFYKKIYYVDHFVFAIHVQTALFFYAAVGVLINLIVPWEGIALIYLIGTLIYTLIAIRRFYNQHWILTIFKFIILNVVLFIVSIIFILLVAFVSVILY